MKDAAVRSRFDRRQPWIDVLRGLAILSVVLLHIDIRIPFAQSEWGASLPREVSRVLFRSGYYGVRVFFVISGFLITSTIQDRSTPHVLIDVKAFYQRRFARIAPCLVALLCLLSALHLSGAPGFVIGNASLLHAVFAALTFHLNQLEIAVGYLPAPWDVLWSLSVEEVFYGVFPLLLFFVRSRAALLGLAGVLIICGPFARTRWAVNDLESDYSYLGGFDAITIGCLAAFAAARWDVSPARTKVARWLGAVLMLLVVVFRSTAGKLKLGLLGLDVTVLAIGTGLLLFGLAGREANERSSPSLLLKPLEWMGRRSYEVYLTHSFLMIWGLQLFRLMDSPKSWIPLWQVTLLLASAMVGGLVARLTSIKRVEPVVTPAQAGA